MPYYRNDVSDQYQGTAFDPYTGRLNGAALVMNFLNQIESRKRKKKEEAWELEDRDTQARRGALAEQNTGLDIAAKKRAAKDYVSPQEKAKYDLASDYFGSIAKQQAAEREIKLRGEEDRKTAAASGKAITEQLKAAENLRKAKTKALADIEKRYTDDVNAIKAEHAKTVASLRKPNAKGEVQGRVESSTGSPYLRALMGANKSRAQRLKDLEARKAREMAAIEQAYSDGDIDSMSVAPQGAVQKATGPIAVNPQTGERLMWDGTDWVPVK